MTYRLAAQEHMLDGTSLEEKFDFARRADFDGIELRGAGDGAFAARLPDLRSARRAGVVMPTVCVQMDHFIGDFDAERRADARAQMKTLLSGIVEAGGFGAITPASYGMFSRRLPPFEPPRTPEADRAILLEELGALGAHAAEVGAVLLLEPLNRYEDHMVNTVADAVSLVAEIGLASVAVVADLYHMNIEETDPVGALTATGQHLRHVQIGDTNRLEPGAGHLDWPATIAGLDVAGYEGWLAMECRLSGPPAEVLPRVSALIRATGG